MQGVYKRPIADPADQWGDAADRCMNVGVLCSLHRSITVGEHRHVRLSWDAVKNVPSQADSRPDWGAHDRMMSDIPEIIGRGHRTPPPSVSDFRVFCKIQPFSMTSAPNPLFTFSLVPTPISTTSSAGGRKSISCLLPSVAAV